MAPHRVCSVLEGRSPPPAPSPPPGGLPQPRRPFGRPRKLLAEGPGMLRAGGSRRQLGAKGAGSPQPPPAAPVPSRPGRVGLRALGGRGGAAAARGMRGCPGARPCAPETRGELRAPSFRSRNALSAPLTLPVRCVTVGRVAGSLSGASSVFSEVFTKSVPA